MCYVIVRNSIAGRRTELATLSCHVVHTTLIPRLVVKETDMRGGGRALFRGCPPSEVEMCGQYIGRG